MPYKCAFGCTSYNPCCDACDGETEGQGYLNSEEDGKLRHKAALRGMTKEEYLEAGEDDE